MPQQDQDALLARLDELQARGMSPGEAQLMAAIDVLTQLERESGIRKSALRYEDMTNNQWYVLGAAMEASGGSSTPLDTLGLSARPYKALVDFGVPDVETLLRIDSRRRKSLPSIGKVGLQEIESALDEFVSKNPSWNEPSRVTDTPALCRRSVM